MRRRIVLAALMLMSSVVQVGGTVVSALSVQALGAADPTARSTGHDAEWLGHAWVDGRKNQSDVDMLARQLRDTGIRDLFVHAGPFNNDGTLDPALRPRARWLTGSLHAALPRVRVQAWLGAHPLSDQLHLHEPATRARIITAVSEVLDDGFDGVHYDFEPVGDGSEDLLAMLRETGPLAAQRGAVLSVSAIHLEPLQGVASFARVLPAALSLWSGDYLRQVADLVDQVALMSYDTGLPTAAAYAGYVRRTTERALAIVPPEVGLLIGIPAYDEGGLYHHPHAESVAAALRGIRLALADRQRERFGVALYVDFTVNDEDWFSYHRDWYRQSPSARSRSAVDRDDTVVTSIGASPMLSSQFFCEPHGDEVGAQPTS
jgi:hypothetical protein